MLKIFTSKQKLFFPFALKYYRRFSVAGTSETTKGIMSTIREVFSAKTLEEDPSNQNKEQKEEVDYADLAKRIHDLSLKDEKIKSQLREIHTSMKKTQEESFSGKDLEYLLTTVRSSDLCHFAVEQFVGSISVPKSEKVMKMLLEYAYKNARTDEEKLEVEYCSLYLRKLNAVQTGNKEEFSQANEELIKLCNESHHPIAMHIVAKEIYKVGLNILNSKQKKDKKKYFSQAYELFAEAAEKGSYQSFYYMGEMAESGDIPGGVDLKLAYEYYLIAASHDSPLAYFKLAKFFREGFVEKKNKDLEFFYTKQAAELGLTEAQHNLGCMYMEGEITKYDSLKALSWFSYAGAAGFQHSMYNAANLYIKGGRDGKVKKNLNAALVWLDRIHKEGKIDVHNIISQVNDMIAEEEGEKNSKKIKDDSLQKTNTKA